MTVLLDITQRDGLQSQLDTLREHEQAASVVRAEAELRRALNDPVEKAAALFREEEKSRKALFGPVDHAAALLSAQLQVPDWITGDNVASLECEQFIKGLRMNENFEHLYGGRLAAEALTAFNQARAAETAGFLDAVTGSTRAFKRDAVEIAAEDGRELDKLFKADYLHSNAVKTEFERAIADASAATKLFDIASAPIRLTLPPNPLLETNRRLKAVEKQSAASAEGIAKLGRVVSELTAVAAQMRLENDRASKSAHWVALVSASAAIVAVVVTLAQAWMQVDEERSRARTDNQIEQLRAIQVRASEEASALRAENAKLSGEINAMQGKQPAPTNPIWWPPLRGN